MRLPAASILLFFRFMINAQKASGIRSANRNSSNGLPKKKSTQFAYIRSDEAPHSLKGAVYPL